MHEDERMGVSGKRKNGLRWLALLACVLVSGPVFTVIVCRINRVLFGLYTWPLIACVDVFAFATAGFFATEGKTEKVYGVCSVVAFLCAIVQLGMLF